MDEAGPPIVGTGSTTQEVIVSRKTASSTARSSSAVLAPLSNENPELAPPVSRISTRPLLPEAFKPEAGQPTEADGKPLTKFGRRFREVFAKIAELDEEAVDLGLVRQVEALNADTSRNLDGLSAVQERRTEHGVLRYVRMLVNTPLVKPWLLNGRALRRMGTELSKPSRIVTTATDHPTFPLPTMRVKDPEAVLDVIGAQQRLLGLESYNSASPSKRDRIDSIVKFGVLEQPDVILVQLDSDSGGSAWVAQAAEGAQRLFCSHVAMDQLASRSVSTLGSNHWFTGTPELRDLTPDDLHRLAGELRFPASAAAGYFPGRDKKSWLQTTATTTPAAVSFQLMRTMEVNLVIAIEPDEQVMERDEKNPVSSTIQEMIRSYHVPGKAKDQWDLADVQGLIAIGAIDQMVEAGRITSADRSIWLAERLPSWQGDDDGSPNRLVAVARLVATLTAQQAAPLPTGDGEDSLKTVNRHLKLNGQRVKPDERARVAAAQAIIASGNNNTGWENTLKAAIFNTFRAQWFWKIDDHEGDRWPALLSMPLKELTDKALSESSQADSADACGSAQRALAALGGLALMANPGLLENDNSLTSTARGAGGKSANVSASDPSVLLSAMVREQRGIYQLHDAVVALTANAEPTVPIDREDSHELDEIYLREMWLGMTSGKKEDNPLAEFARLIKELTEVVDQQAAQAEFLRTAPPGRLLGLDESKNPEPEFWDEAVYDRIGISEETADKALPALQQLVDFFTTGKAYARAAARASK